MNKNYFTSIIPIKTLKSFCFLLVTFFSIFISSYGQTGVFKTSGNVEIPAGVGVPGNSIKVQAWGAGGAGGGAAKLLNLLGVTLLSAGGGGGGGAFNTDNINVGTNPNNVTVNYTVGTGGLGEISSSNRNGKPGNPTSFPTAIASVLNTSVFANGGNGGNIGGLTLATRVGGGGDGGVGQYSGGKGNSASLLNLGLTLVSGGGGGGAGSNGNGSNSINGVLSRAGGAGGAGNVPDEVGGSGADGLVGELDLLGALLGGGNENGKPGFNPGGGGGGAAILVGLLGSGMNGGKGGDGQIKITYSCPTYTVENVSASSICKPLQSTTVNLTSTAAGLPVGKYTVSYDVSSSSSLTSGSKEVSVTIAGTLSFQVTDLTTLGTNRIIIKNLTSGKAKEDCPDCFCSTNISGKYVDVIVSTVPNQPGVISGSVNQCVGNTSQTYSIDPVANATSYIWTVNTASGWEITSGQNSNSITVKVGTAAANVSVVAVNECGNSSASSLAVNFNLPPVTASATLQPTCEVNTGTITVTAPVPSTGVSYRVNGADYSETNTTGIFTLVPIGSYNVTAEFPSGCVTNPAVVSMLTSVATKTWNGTTWSPYPLIMPTIEEKVVFESNYNKDESVTACSCEVKSGANVFIKSGHYLKLRNELTVSTTGSLTFENNSSLVQINDAAINLGNIIYKRNTDITRYDYTYWSSPVVGQTLKNLSFKTLFDKYFSYDSNLGWQVSINGVAAMKPGHGYIIRGPQDSSTTETATFTGSFIGTPHNGIFNNNDLKVEANKSYLLGNPYPSAIDADKFLMDNSGLLEGTLYFWTNNTPPVATGTTMIIYKYTASDYASYNRTGGVGTIITGGATKNGFPPNGRIAAGQGFFAPAKGNGNLTFNNSMRLSGNTVIDNSQFFKLNDVSKSNAADATTTIEKNRVWLNLTNEEGAFKQTLIGYITGATNDYEGSFDGVSYDGNQYVDFYSINQELNLSIQGRALPFQQKDSVALGYKTTIAGNFKINIDHVDGVMVSQKVFLEDKTTQVLHDLKEPYSFTTEKGIFNDRFVLRYEDKNAVIEDIVDVAVEGVLISSKNKIITIDTTDEIIKTIYVYDFSGRLVYSDTDVNVTATSISNLSNAAQALIVQVVLENGKKAVKKIIY